MSNELIQSILCPHRVLIMTTRTDLGQVLPSISQVYMYCIGVFGNNLVV